MVNRSANIWVIAFILLGVVLLMSLLSKQNQNGGGKTVEEFGGPDPRTSSWTDTFEQCSNGPAPYYIPWWRRYYKQEPYYHGKEDPYWNGSWYWWRHYGKNFYQNYWKNYGVRV